MKFFRGCTCFLRTCEVLFQSGGAADCDSAANSYQLPGPDVQDLFKLIVENLLAGLHGAPPKPYLLEGDIVVWIECWLLERLSGHFTLTGSLPASAFPFT